MPKIKPYLILLIVCLLLVSCQGNGQKDPKEQDHINTTLDEIRQENILLTKQIEELRQAPSEEFMMDFRRTMNLAFKIIHAMNTNDYKYLESVSSKGVTINRDTNQVWFLIDKEEITMNFLKDLNLNNLEYWGYDYKEKEGKCTLIFAHFFEETHSTIYIDFIKNDEEWFFNGFITNA